MSHASSNANDTSIVNGAHNDAAALVNRSLNTRIDFATNPVPQDIVRHPNAAQLYRSQFVTHLSSLRSSRPPDRNRALPPPRSLSSAPAVGSLPVDNPIRRRSAWPEELTSVPNVRSSSTVNSACSAPRTSRGGPAAGPPPVLRPLSPSCGGDRLHQRRQVLPYRGSPKAVPQAKRRWLSPAVPVGQTEAAGVFRTGI